MKLISIIVPVFNHEIFLEARFKSILNQTYKNFEVIILDDCSTDNSKDIIEKYRRNDKVSQIVYNEYNSGSPFKQWKKGFELAKGEWIWIAESDDYCESNFLEELISRIEPNYKLITCRTEQIDENGKFYKRGYFLADEVKSGRWHSDFENNGLIEISEALKYRCTIPNASAVIFHKSLAKNVEGVLDFKAAGDWYFWIRCLSETNVKYVSKPLAYHRFHNQTTRSQKSLHQEINRMKEFLKCINLSYKICRKNNLENEVSIFQYNWLYYELYKRNFKARNLLVYRYLPYSLNIGYWNYFNKKSKRIQKIPQKILLKLKSLKNNYFKKVNEYCNMF